MNWTNQTKRLKSKLFGNGTKTKNAENRTFGFRRSTVVNIQVQGTIQLWAAGYPKDQLKQNIYILLIVVSNP